MALLTDAFGVLGLVLLLSAFIANALGRMPSDSVLYGVLNFAGGTILAIYSAILRVWVFFPLEALWALVALGALVKRARGKKGGAKS